MMQTPEVLIPARHEAQYSFQETLPQDPEWKEFVRAQAPNFFCLPEWCGILDAGYRIQTKIYLLKENNKIKIGLPAAFFNFKWFRLIHGYTPYGEMAGDLTLVPVFIKHLEAHCRKNGIHQIRITQRFPYEYPLAESYRHETACQHILSLEGCTETSLWDGFKKNIRRDVRRAQRSGITVCPLENHEGVNAYYELYRKTMQRKRVFGPHPRHFYHEIREKLSGQNRVLFLAAMHEGKLIAGALLIFDKETAYLLGNVSDPDFLTLCPNDLLIHESILESLRRGMAFFDFMTTGEDYTAPGSLSAFKEKWGAARNPFSVYEKDLSPLRAGLWNILWKTANTPSASFFLRPFLNR